MKAIIDKVDRKQSKSGKTYFAVVAGGKHYNCWEAHVAGLAGKTVTFEEESQEVGDKTYWNMKSVKEVAPEADPRQASITMSYAKDIVVALIASKEISNVGDALTSLKDAYDVITAVLTHKEEKADEENPFE